MINRKKRGHEFGTNISKKRRVEEQQAPASPATDHPIAIPSQSRNHDCVAALPLEDVGATIIALKESSVQLLNEVKTERAALARDVAEYRKLQEEAKKHDNETAKTFEAAYADICATVDEAEANANTQLLKEVDERIQQLAQVARADFVTEVKTYEARHLAESKARDAQSADDIEARVLAEVKRRVARMTRGIETGVLVRMQTRDVELANEIETSVLAKVQTRMAGLGNDIEARVLIKSQTSDTELANGIEAGVLAKVQTQNSNIAKDVEAGVLLRMQAYNAGLAQEVEAGVLLKLHSRIEELTKQVKGKVLAEIDKTSFPDTAENVEELERYVDMRARVEGAFRAGHDENGNHGGDEDRDHGSEEEAPARAPHSFEALGIDSMGVERVRHNGRTYMCPADPDDVLGVEKRRHHHFEVFEDS